MKTLLDRVTHYLKNEYGVEIKKENAGSENYVNIADFSGKTIRVNTSVRGDEELIFIIAHLFGHMVQFSNYPHYKELVEETERPKPLQLSEEFKAAFYAYEREGYAIGKALLEQALGPTKTEQLDERYQLYLETDFTAFWSYITTGVQISSVEFEKKLRENYRSGVGQNRKPLTRVDLPREIHPQRGAVVF
jgi:hypothetical protein